MPKSDYTPTTTDVAKFVRARTRDNFGNLVGDFTDATAVPADVATELISEAVDELADRIGEDLNNPDDIAAAKRLAELLAAANIEISLFPEQAAANNSMYDKLMKRYNDNLGEFQSNLEETIEEPAEVNVGPTQGGFPPTSGFGWRPM